MKIMNLGDARTAEGVAAVLQNDDDDAVDPHLERIRNEAGGDESDEEVNIIVFCGARWFLSSPPNLSFCPPSAAAKVFNSIIFILMCVNLIWHYLGCKIFNMETSGGLILTLIENSLYL